MPQFIGLGTIINVVAVLLGSVSGVLIGSRLPVRTRTLITDTLGLITLVIAIAAVASLGSQAITDSVGRAGLLVIVISMLVGGIFGSAMRLEKRFSDLGARLRPRRAGRPDTQAGFVNGFVTSSLVFCLGPLTVLGALNEGLGQGSSQLMLKSVMDGVTAIAFASALGVGVAFSAVTILIVQGSLTLLGWALGDVLTMAQIDALNVAGGVLLFGIALRVLEIKNVPVVDMLPALITVPLGIGLVSLAL